tara:strand:+ start:56862 stop:57821 length:960 start_codon:yes stop_codon:yes gene_type:complete
MIREPLISIIIPTYNREELIEETLTSIKSQTYRNWECIIVDDGSTDNTFARINNISNKDERFKIVRRPSNRKPGGNGARNYGLEISNGDYVNWFDSDDLMIANKLAFQLGMLQEDNDLDFVISQCTIFKNTPDKIIGVMSKNVFSENLFEDFVKKKVKFFTPSVLFKKSYLLKNNLSFDETLKAGQEWEFFARVLYNNPKSNYTMESLSLIRQHKASISTIKWRAHTYWNYALARIKIFKMLKKHNDEVSLMSFFKKYFQEIFFQFVSTKNFKYAYKLLATIFPELFSKKEIVKAYCYYFLQKNFKKGHILRYRIFDEK